MSNMLNTRSFRFITCAFLLLNLVTESTQMRRWLNPCGTLGNGQDAAVDIFSNSGRLSERSVQMSQQVQSEVMESVHLVLERMTSLKRKVKELKELYVRERFRQPSIVDDFERIGLRIDGMPVIKVATASSLATINLMTTIHKAFENLARISVFLDQARLGETVSKVDRVSFADFFRRLENDHEHGIYWHLCSLYRIVIRLPQPHLDPVAVRSVQALKVTEVDSVAVRHTRDYLVLRDTERTLEHTLLDFGALTLMYQRRS